MPVVLALTLALQVSVRVGPAEKARADSVRRAATRDSIRREIRMEIEDDQRRPPRRVPVTPELERTAFRDSAARTLLLAARDARMRLDSTLNGYDASAYQRLSVGMGFRAIGRDRLFFRTENASRVRWSRTSGLHIDVKGRRTAFPMAQGEEGEVEMGEMGPIPYYPGREQLWVGGGSGIARAEVDERELIHPIAIGAEAYYRYAAGDSLTITLSDGKAIRLRELRVEPRKPDWRFSVGSFWFDQGTGQLVRAVYRFAAVMNIWTVADEEIERERQDKVARGEKPDPDEVPGWLKAMVTPMEANLEAVTIEYGLYGGRYWLPRTQYAEGYAKAAFMRIPFKFEESFKYASVNGTDSLPVLVQEKTYRELRDSLFGRDSVRWRDLPDSVRRARVAVLARVDSVRREERKVRRAQECSSTGYYSQVESRFDGSIKATVRVPCDTTVLARSSDLPASIYDDGEELFGVSERNELLKALDFSLQPVWAPMPIRLEYGLGQSRFNRVEGFSTGIRGTQLLGKGYSWDAMARMGTADLSVYGDLGVSRTNGRHVYRLGGYRRLAVANNDWGSPLSFGASLGSLLYGRDEGYYYRASGVELDRSLARGGGLGIRAFVERQHLATWNTRFNVSRALGSATEFLPNIPVERSTVAGVALRRQFTRGIDPSSWRLLGDTRLEGGVLLDRTLADSADAYGRIAGDLTVSGPLAGKFGAALTTSAGYSRGAPIQRQYFLGGAQTVRGQLLGTRAGEAYWLTRLETGRTTGVARTVLFGDMGWAGPWAQRSSPGRPISGVGIGQSVLDGLIRLDLSRGLYPRKQMRLDLYVEAKF